MTDRTVIAMTDDGRMRIRVAWVTDLTQEACHRHAAVGVAAHALGRGLGCAATFPTYWKDTERISVQWSGPGPIGTLLCEARAGGAIRGRVGNPHAGVVLPSASSRGLGYGLGIQGGFVNVITQVKSGQFAQSRVDMTSGEVDEDLEHWFLKSDQVPTRLRVMTTGDAAGVPEQTLAVVVQLLPGAGPDDLPPAELLEDLNPNAPAEHLLKAALEGRDIKIMEEWPLRFECQCSRDRVEAGLMLLETDELLDMINEDKGANIRCDFCAEKYTVNREQLEDIMVRKVTGSDDSPGTQDRS